jgi:TolB-like protein/DNA-binding winged helix-turn-helix (wHTH) protein/Tfp pilus assembly protein PilF
MNRQRKYFYDFGPFRFESEQRVLLRDGKPIPLPPKVAETLLLLVQNPGQLIEKDDLIRGVWPDTFVEEGNLNKNIFILRKTLAHQNGGREYIETVPKRGYRFVASVTREVEENTSSPTQVSMVVKEIPARTNAPRRAKHIAAVLLGLIVAIAIGWLVVAHRHEPSGNASPPGLHSLAVLPLENLSSDLSQDYFADGMTDELITSLGQVDSLRVISRTSVMQYKGTRKPLPQVARELNVDAIVEGTVVRSGGQVRITAQLIQARDEKHLWAQNYQGDMRDVLALQNQIASAFAKQIKLTLNLREGIRTGIGSPINPQAYESYLKGEYLLNRLTEESVQKAVDLFQLAIEQDPNYAPSYVKLAGSNQILANMNVIPKKVAYTKAEQLVARALELDPQFSAAHAVQGWGFLEYELDFAAAGAEFKRAVELNPNGVEGHEGLANYYQTMGQLPESVQEMERARELDPLALIVNTDLCRSLYFARRYDEALAQCKADIDLDPNAPRTFWFLGDVYAAKRIDSEAVASFLHAFHLIGAPPVVVAAAENGAKDSGVKGFWRAVVHFLPASTSNGSVDPFEAAIGYAYAGDADKTLIWLRKAVEDRSFGITYLGVNPTFDEVRSDQRFISLLRQMGLPLNRRPLPPS